MVRMVILAGAVVALASCDKLRRKHEREPAPVRTTEPAKSGHSVTVLASDASVGSAGPDRSAPEPATGSGAPAGTGSARHEHLMGGDGSPAHRGDDGWVHGPGGPVFMGRGVTCDAAHDHCLRDGVWFSVAHIQAGKQFRALPVFELDKKWWTWRGERAEDPVKLYRTQIAGNAKVAPGTPVIWYANEDGGAKWADSEYEALTSSHWEAGVVEAQVSPKVVKIAGIDAVPLDTIRLIIETRGP